MVHVVLPIWNTYQHQEYYFWNILFCLLVENVLCVIFIGREVIEDNIVMILKVFF